MPRLRRLLHCDSRGICFDALEKMHMESRGIAPRTVLPEVRYSEMFGLKPQARKPPVRR